MMSLSVPREAVRASRAASSYRAFTTQRLNAGGEIAIAGKGPAGAASGTPVLAWQWAGIAVPQSGMANMAMRRRPSVAVCLGFTAAFLRDGAKGRCAKEKVESKRRQAATDCHHRGACRAVPV